MAEDHAATRARLNQFLQGVERQALHMANLATRQRDDALELVQEAMLGFVKSYAHKPDAEWRPLFFTVLESRLRDWHRRQIVRRRVWFSLPTFDDADDPIQTAADQNIDTPLDHALGADAAKELEHVLRELPPRQRQAFLYRVWEQCDVATTARIMKCSEGSVKTHLFRAMERIRSTLGWMDT